LTTTQRGPRERMTYFTGAYPSMCGKTSTAMLEGESIVGDDIAYLRRGESEVRAANAERGMFGIIQGVNAKDDPLLWKALNSSGEIIFSNVMVTDAGAETNLHYASDITRTTPVGGKFNEKQKNIYEIVLKANTETIKATKPGMSNRDLHFMACKILTTELKNLVVMRPPDKATA